MGVSNYEELKRHIEHKVEVAWYGDGRENPDNVAIECMDCGEVLLDFDRDTEPLKTLTHEDLISLLEISLRFLLDDDRREDSIKDVLDISDDEVERLKKVVTDYMSG